MNTPELSEIPEQKLKTDPNFDLLKGLFAKNPFYIVSAGLLLYGIYRLSVDPKVFGTEIGQLFFNFGSFQFYELLLVITAIVLGRRQIWYDSALLVCLENLFVFVPFILISQALLVEGEIAVLFCVLGTALVVARFGGLKKYFQSINFPARLLLLGGVLLGVNLGLPLLVRTLHKDRNMFLWENLGENLVSISWLGVLPILLGLANFLPRPKHSGEHFLSKGVLPLVLFTIWTLVTAVHFYSVGYVYELKWNFSFAAPLLWAAAWTLRNRLGDFAPDENEENGPLRDALLLPPILAPFATALTGNWIVFLVLTICNALFYAGLVYRERSTFAFHLLTISGALIFGGLPDNLLKAFGSFSREEAFGSSIGIYILLRATFSGNPKLGILGSIIAAIFAGVLFQNSHDFFGIATQVGLTFLLIHSLRWVDAENVGAGGTRILAALISVMHAFIWIANGSATAAVITASLAGATLVIYFAARIIFGIWGSRIVLYSAILVLLCKPVFSAGVSVKDAPTGMLALIGSFILFGVGTVAALTKNRRKNDSPMIVPTSTNNAQ